ncbi:probable P23 protein [alpha proteobacterium U9-1i]|nr:probable P23 protein [alpha proteobacterium U9-1i]
MAVYVDADACAVKNEIYKVALRLGVPVFVVANTYLRVPSHALLKAVAVDAGPDVADDWIAERAGMADVVVTSDLPLADRCLKAGAIVLAQTGKEWTLASIGAALASRAVMEHLRSFGEGGGGPPPFSAADRSRFLSALDAALHKAAKRGAT